MGVDGVGMGSVVGMGRGYSVKTVYASLLKSSLH